MNEFGGLIEKISNELDIKKDYDEVEEMWKARVVYSVAGRMAVASLYDVLEDNQPVSVTHLKRRCQKVFEAYWALYPELRLVMTSSAEEYAEEIYSILIATGSIYHTPNRILPSAEKRVSLKNIELQRGTAVGEKLFVSGIGTYQINKGGQSILDVFDLFQIPMIKLSDYGHHLVCNAKWSDFEARANVEYLRMEPPFTRGYWKDTPELNGKVSLLRTGQKGGYLYYLYKCEKNRIRISALPSWLAEGSEYRNISNSILALNGMLPSLYVEKKKNKKNVVIKQEYLLPNSILDFIKLYSWPARFMDGTCDFIRVMNKEIFDVLNEILQIMGIEVKVNV